MAAAKALVEAIAEKVDAVKDGPQTTTTQDPTVEYPKEEEGLSKEHLVDDASSKVSQEKSPEDEAR